MRISTALSARVRPIVSAHIVDFARVLALSLGVLVAASTPATSSPLSPAASQPQTNTAYSLKPVKSRLGQIIESDPSLLA